MGFAEDIQRNIDIAMLNISNNLNEITGKLFYGIRQDTPVLKGVLNNSWYTGVKNTFDETVGTTADMSGSGSISRISSMLSTNPFLGVDNSVTLTNSVSYAYQAEVDGWAKKPAYAMVQNNLIKAGK